MIKKIKELIFGRRIQGEIIFKDVAFNSIYPERFSQDNTTDFNKTWEHIFSVRKQLTIY